nr:unnamed protein product [Digitaria exilis]
MVVVAVVAVLRSALMTQGRPARDAGAGQAARWLLGAGAPAAAVERHERVGGYGGLAHGAPLPRRAPGVGFGVGAQPLRWPQSVTTGSVAHSRQMLQSKQAPPATAADAAGGASPPTILFAGSSPAPAVRV